MDFEIAIPSYRRADILRKKTLAYLSEQHFPADKITIFVSSDDEKKTYEDELVLGSYARIVVAIPGLANKLNFIRQYYPEGTAVLRVDDDIRRIKMLQPRPLFPLVQELFEVSKREGCSLWGIYPVNNLFFCKERVLVGKVYVIGCFHGFFNDKSVVFPPEISSQEDKWLSLTHYKKEGKCLRYEGICPDTTYFAHNGLEEWRKAHHEESVKKMLELFPTECVRKERKDGYADCVWRTVKTKEFSLGSR